MGEVIRFLESLGGLPPMSAVDFDTAVNGLSVDAEVRDALKGADASVLGRFLDGRAAMFCLVATPEEEQHESSPDDQDGDGKTDQDELPGQSS